MNIAERLRGCADDAAAMVGRLADSRPEEARLWFYRMEGVAVAAAALGEEEVGRDILRKGMKMLEARNETPY